ncbi:MAG: hypothetical protein Q8O55_09335 [Dehalococcoidales bacterium]|nr:hypothetical protein [Dehalococcoidales bacterium]
MPKKILVVSLLALSLLLLSCYPELSAQQYDKLRKELAELDARRQELEAKNQVLEAELTAFKEKNTETLTYVKFLDKLVTTQKSEMILSGQFDARSLISSSANLTSFAESMEDGDINFYLGLMKPENESQIVTVYYKVIEYSLKKMRQNLEER